MNRLIDVSKDHGEYGRAAWQSHWGLVLGWWTLVTVMGCRQGVIDIDDTVINRDSLVIKTLSSPPGDYGDAPDSGYSAGYYGLAGQPLGIKSKFIVDWTTHSTLSPANVGLFTQSGAGLFIDNLFDLNPHLPPSLEAGVEDPADPDGSPPCSNNISTAFYIADHDRENAQHPSPCLVPSTPFGAANALLFILPVSVPPIAFFVTAAYAPAPVSGYWNVLFDNDQDGAWLGSGVGGVGEEWIVKNLAFSVSDTAASNLDPTLLVSGVFAFGQPGFGPLAFPMWVRNVVTTARLNVATWDGSGPSTGFTTGEVEDYFLEWFPIGQRKECPAEGCGQQEVQDFPRLVCPATAGRFGGIARTTCPIPKAAGFDGVLIGCAAGGDPRSATRGTALTRITRGTAAACQGFAPVKASLEPGFIAIEVGPTGADLQLILGLAPTDGRNVTVGARIVVPRS